MMSTYDEHYGVRCCYCATTDGPLTRVEYVRHANRGDDGGLTACAEHLPHVRRGLAAARSVEVTGESALV